MNGLAHDEPMSTGAFALLLTGSLVAAVFGGYGLVFVLTRDEGRYKSWHWRVHLADLGRTWSAQLLPPWGGPWTTVGSVPREAGRAAATELAWRAVDSSALRS